MSLARLIGPELAALVREKDWPVLTELVQDDIHPEDFADVIGQIDHADAAEALTQLPTEFAAQVFERLNEEQQESIASHLGVASTARIATAMDVDDLADFVAALPVETEEALLEHLEKVDPEIVVEIGELTRWPEQCAGGLMTTDFVSVASSLTIEEAINEFRNQAEDIESNLETIYVVDQRDRVQGYLTMRDLLLHKPHAKVSESMHQRVISVPPELDQEQVAMLFAKYDLNTLPVIENDTLLGVITSDDIIDVVTEEQDEDVQKMGAVEPIEGGYFSASTLMHLRKRSPWLLILFMGGFLTASAMQTYHTVLEAVATLAIYVPLLISAGGNSGAQSSTLVIRGLAVGDISTRDWIRIVTRELALGLMLGSLLAVFGVVRVILAGDGAPMAWLIGGTIVAIVVLGCVIGGMMPLILHRLGIDPASSSTPFIATLVDVLGILVYLGLAGWLLSGAISQAGGP
jgi:magnesium transporter